MAKQSDAMPFVTIELDRRSAVPMHRQLYDYLREAILSGQLAGGLRLPATRALAEELGVSRNTVMGAFDQLLAEGYMEGKVGAGTYVARVLPEEVLNVAAPPNGAGEPQRAKRTLSQRGQLVANMPRNPARFREVPRAFRPSLPALEAFPFRIWAGLLSKHWRDPSAELLGPGDPAGYGPLREAVAGYLGASRGVRCHPDQVVITTGSQQALDLVARTLLDPGDTAWVEEPGYLGTRGALLAASIQMAPVPVDAEGLDVATGIERAPAAKLICVSPSCQYPLGMTMSLARRLALLEWAGKSGAWVLEDDYDSEYRYANRPLAALQGVDTEGRVIYVGSFSKVLFPSLRLGYLVAPPDLVGAFVAMRSRTDLHAPTPEQVVLTDFIEEGHFARHIRRMRSLYAERQAVLVEEAGKKLGGLLEVRPADAGMHLIGWLVNGMVDVAASVKAMEYGVLAPALSTFYLEKAGSPGLLLGYTGVSEDEIREGVRRLTEALSP
ncbi:MAG: PLP-dependent aminotransferase family protein [Chloroflexia bacterium]